MNTPFFDKMAAVSRRGPRFFVPGHKGNAAAIPAFAEGLRWDLTEVDGACDLSHPEAELAQSQANMAAAYGAGATLYSASGSTSCIQAMIALFCGEGGTVVMARGAHVAALRAMALLDITPAWVPLREGYPLPGDVDAALAASNAKAVYVTSPDYYGRLADIAGIAAVCRAHGAALLVDNAHGAYLRFYPGPDGVDFHPLTLGADATADSAHKTLPCLTPAAMLHLRDAALANDAREALNLFCSTSPSYLVLESLDLAAGLLLENPPDFAGAARQLREAGEGFAQIAAPCDDPLRLVLRPAQADVDPRAFHDALLAAGFAPEYFDGEALVLMASPWNTGADFAALHDALALLAWAGLPAAGAPPRKTAALPIPEAVLSIREAFFAPHERVPTGMAAGRVCGGLFAPCPPGVPLAAPGERLSEAMCAQLAAGGILHLDVVK